MLEIGSLVDGKYKVLSEIGHGGMSVVYLAIVERANQTWAIKEVRKNGATKDDIVQQGLVAEMNILKRLNHPHLPRIIDIIDHEDSFLIVMDYIEGIDLDKKLREGPQKWSDVVEWGKQLCDVFAYLHSRKPPIIYRDMKPGNVKLKPNGDVVLFDFGTAREYKSQKAGDDTTCLGTRGYAAPEQYGGMGQTDARSDIYCLGATMFHLVTGRLPGGPPDYNIPPIRSICPWLPRTGKEGNCVRGLEKIIMKCVEPSPANRYQNCAELMYDLEHIDRISDEFVKGQKKKINTWISCVAFSLIFAICSGVFSSLATRTTENNYEGYITDAFVSAKSGMTPKDSGYNDVEEKLKEAIKVNPKKSDAWIYLSKLYSADLVVTPTEERSMQDFIRGYGKKLSESPNDEAQFYMEWSESVFFFYSSNPDVLLGAGSPEVAEPYLKTVVGDEKTLSENYKRLIRTDSGVKVPLEQYQINSITEGEAQSRFKLAQSLYAISKQWKNRGKVSGVAKDTTYYPFSVYWRDLKNLLRNAQILNDSSLNIVNVNTLRAAIYSNVMYAIDQNFADLVEDGGAKIEFSENDPAYSVKMAQKMAYDPETSEESEQKYDISIMEIMDYACQEAEKLKALSITELMPLIDNVSNMRKNIEAKIASVIQ